MSRFLHKFSTEHAILRGETHSDAWHETIYSLAFVVVLSKSSRRPLVHVFLNKTMHLVIRMSFFAHLFVTLRPLSPNYSR